MRLTAEELQELKRVSAERIAAESLRRMGVTPKDSLGVRYEKM
jgi:DNA-binding CsgD family transcriptional regulator